MKKLSKKFNLFCFSHWANKPYAVFNSLKRNIKIGVLSVTYSLITLSAQDVFAQPDTLKINKTVMLSEATVTKTKQHVYSDMVRIVAVITKNEISKMPVRTLQDLLENISGVDVRSRGTEGVQADISIRGGTFDQVLILLNGINVTDPQTGHHNLNIPFDIESIEKIEVLEGSGSRVLGANAFSGAINIITTKAKDNYLNFKLNTGQNNYIAPTISGTFTTKNKGIHASVSHNQSDGYRQNTDFKITNYYLQTYLKNKFAGQFDFQGAFQNKAFGANGFYSPAFPNQFEHTHTLFSSLKWAKELSNLKLESAAYWRRHYDRFELIRDSSYGRNFHRTDASGIQIRLNYFWKIGKTVIGANYRHEKIISSALGDLLPKPIDVNYYNSISLRPKYTRGAKRDIVDYFIDQTFYLSKFSISGGILGSWSSKYGNNLYFGADAAYQLTYNYKIYAGVNQSLRLPNYTELYYKAPGYMGNENVKPEKALTYESGIKYTKSNFSSSLSLYYRHSKNIIDWIKINVSDNWESKNLTKIDVYGLEVATNYSPKIVWLKNLRLSAMWQNLNKHSQNYISKYALDYLKYKVNLGIDHSLFLSNLISSWSFLYQDRAGSYIDFKTNNEAPYKSYFLVNYKLSYTMPSYKLFIDISNLFDKKYIDISNIEQPGFWLKAGLQINIGK